ncbi:MAG TPA: sugar phosphate nucleotidyltransferase [Polyangiaceae bacterium]|nr:sugar phosphate nucleotidyltransferase [Polyangiaceae bacterium]
MQIVVLPIDMPAETAASLRLVRGRPFVDWQLDRFVASGARSVVMCVGAHGEQIESHVRRALDRGLSVSYSYDGGQLLGSGGTLRRAFARLESEFVLTFAERYLPFDYSAPLQDLRAHPEALATMSVSRSPGNVALDGELVANYDAGLQDFCSYGAVALRRSTLGEIEDGAVWNLDALFRRLARQRKLRAFVAPEPAFDVGSPDLERHLARQPLDL